MRILLPVALAALLSTSNAFAASCTEQASEQKLTGAAKTKFMKSCNATVNQTSDQKCEAKAAERRLAGDAYHKFMKSCQGRGSDRES